MTRPELAKTGNHTNEVTMDFSQRMGLLPASKIIQESRIDDDLRVALWNFLIEHCWGHYASPYGDSYKPVARSNLEAVASKLYSKHYKRPVDTLPEYWADFLKEIRATFFRSEWHRIYSLIEFMAEHGISKRLGGPNVFENYIEACNDILEQENSAYRFVSGKITPITSPDEIEEIERAITISDQYAGVRTHIQTSLGFLTDRNNPDYRNSIKESISAVESLAKKLVGDDKATLGQALKVLEKKHHLHPSLKTAFSALYGYTNDADGIRHSLMDNESQLTKADARFMLICCSAFINFAIDSVED